MAYRKYKYTYTSTSLGHDTLACNSSVKERIVAFLPYAIWVVDGFLHFEQNRVVWRPLITMSL